MDLTFNPTCNNIMEEESFNDFETDKRSRIFRIGCRHQKTWNAMMMNNENGGTLSDRIDDLERRVQSQEDELMCLRSSTAEALRRLNGLEQSLSSTNSSTKNSMPATPITLRNQRISSNSGNKQSSQNRIISRSAYNLHTVPVKNGLSNKNITPIKAENCDGTETPETSPKRETSPQTYPRLRRYIRRNADKVISPPAVQQTSNSKQTPIMKKWMSSADMKCNIRRGSADHLNIVSNKHIGASVTNLSLHKSTNKLGSMNSLSTSQRSLSRFGLEVREPSFLRDKGVLQISVNGKVTNLPAPHSVTDLDPLRELDAPSCHPALDWVYGYRGKDCRGNLHELPTGEIVYFTGTIVILHNPGEQSQRFYTKHTSDIRCMAIHPNKLHIATGQTSRRFLEKNGLSIHRSPISSITELNNVLEQDQYQAHVRIWDSITLQTLRTIGMGEASANFDRGVQCCSFSHAAGGALLAIVDDSYEHILSIWEWTTGKLIAETKERVLVLAKLK